jgi:hypothetical protein
MLEIATPYSTRSIITFLLDDLSYISLGTHEKDQSIYDWYEWEESFLHVFLRETILRIQDGMI